MTHVGAAKWMAFADRGGVRLIFLQGERHVSISGHVSHGEGEAMATGEARRLAKELVAAADLAEAAA